MNWNLIARQLRTTVHFNNQTELAEFVLRVAQLADEQDHHPDFTVRHCSELSIAVYSHDENRITERDYQLVEGITRLYREIYPAL